jgi:hypothetical protein
VFNAHDRKLMMATLSELVETVAEAEGMDSATVALIARYAREAGFIQKKGRGPSAAHMNVIDAANLLIAVNASGAAREAAVVIPVYRDLISTEILWADEKRRPKIYGSFGEAMELIIESAVEGKLPSTFLSKDVPGEVREAFQQGNISISVHFSRPEPSSYIRISSNSAAFEVGPAGEFRRIPFSTPSVSLSFNPRSGRQTRAPLKASGDRTDETKIGSRTIFSVARTLRSSPQNDRKAE